MTFQYQYGIYNPGQYPVDVQKAWDAMVADGWQVNSATPAYNEIYILWQRELPVPEDEPAPRGRRAAQKHRENPEPEEPAEQISGGLRAHEGQDAR